MRILVTGGAGFIGSHLVERLVERGDDVTVVDDLSAAGSTRPRSGAFAFVQGDVRSPRVLDHAFGAAPYDVVVHLAARVGVRESLLRPAEYEQVNVGGTRALLQRLTDGRTRLVFASSSSVYGERHRGPFAEGDPLRPVSPYAETKVAGEALCRAHGARHGTPITCLRFFTAYGPRQRPDMAIARFLSAVLAGTEIHQYGDGSTRRDYTFVGDVVAAIEAAARPSRGVRCFNVGTGVSTSLRELIRSIESVTGRRAHVVPRPNQQGDVSLTHADLTRARADLDFEPRVALDEGLRRSVIWLTALASCSAE